MPVIDNIRIRQTAEKEAGQLPEHRPEMLYIGCIDARLDPIDDLGIAKGTALIFRNIAALVPPDGNADSEHDSIGAALEFFLSHISSAPDKMKHIVVSGHTDCGGLKMCRDGGNHPHDHHLPRYLERLRDVREEVMGDPAINDWDDLDILRALEETSVRQSVANLLTYPPVREAIDQGRLEIHGWVIDTATRQIREMNPDTLEFEPMESGNDRLARIVAAG